MKTDERTPHAKCTKGHSATKKIPCEICEIRFACEILLHNVKCAAARWEFILFHIRLKAEYFTQNTY